MTLDDFFNEYQHFYLINGQGEDNQYLLYKLPPTYTYNCQCEAHPEIFYEETKIYNGVRAANLSTLHCPPKIKQQLRKPMSKQIQGLLFHGQYN